MIRIVYERAKMILIYLLPRPCLRIMKYVLLVVAILAVVIILLMDKRADILILNSINFESAIAVKEPSADHNGSNRAHAKHVTSEHDTSTYTLKPDNVPTKDPSNFIRNKTGRNPNQPQLLKRLKRALGKDDIY